MKLQTKILLLLVPLIVLPLLGVGWFAYAQLRETSYQRTLNQTDTLLHQLEMHFRERVDTARASLELFSASAVLERYVLTADEAERYALVQPTLLRLFASYQQAYPEYYEIRVLLPDGYEDARAAATGFPNATDDEADTGYFRAMAESGADHFVAVVVSPDTGEPVMIAAKRLVLSDRSFDPLRAHPTLRGYLVLTVDMGFLAEQIRADRIGERGYVLVADHEGRILFHPDESRRYTQLPEPLRSASHTGESPHALAGIRYDGRSYLALAHELHDRLRLIALLPRRELLAESTRLGAVVAGITAATILLTITLLFALLKRLLVLPIQRLGRAAQEIGRGNLEAPIEVHSQDEIGQLAVAFRHMGQSLAQSHDQIRFLAYHDSLTGLPNRLMFREYLIRVLGEAERRDALVALLFLDVDHFKRVNDTLGHHAGDDLLKEFSARLTSCLRRGDYVAREAAEAGTELVARLGGDEFIVLLPDVKDPLQAGSVARRILENLKRPFKLGAHEFYVGASIGITMFPADGRSADELIKNADIAMYHAKSQGRGNFQYFSSTLNEAAFRRLSLEGSLRKALEHDELELHYQPLLDFNEGRICGVEALLRWRHPELGMIPPDTFIPLAEDCGLIVPIGEWVLREACRQQRAWIDSGIAGFTVAVNVSSIQVGKQDIRALIRSALGDSRLDADRLEVELTESSILSANSNAVETLKAIKELGVRISLDDFGTGYSSLSYLRRFPIDTLKIDRSFVRDITTDPDDAAIIEAIIFMAHTLRLKVVAEGIETDDQLAFLRTKGCDRGQGYLIGRPLPARELVKVLSGKTALRALG